MADSIYGSTAVHKVDNVPDSSRSRQSDLFACIPAVTGRQPAAGHCQAAVAALPSCQGHGREEQPRLWWSCYAAAHQPASPVDATSSAVTQDATSMDGTCLYISVMERGVPPEH